MLGAAGPSPPAPPPMSPHALRSLYAWLDRLPLSRPKRHLARDFSDGGEGATGRGGAGCGWPAAMAQLGPVPREVSQLPGLPAKC